jgi:hypothetical protein
MLLRLTARALRCFLVLLVLSASVDDILAAATADAMVEAAAAENNHFLSGDGGQAGRAQCDSGAASPDWLAPWTSASATTACRPPCTTGPTKFAASGPDLLYALVSLQR